MNCPSKGLKDFVLWCCAEGTYVERGGRLLSFSREPRPECMESVPSEDIVMSESESEVVKTFLSLCGLILGTVTVLLCCRAYRKNKKEEEKEIRREERRKVKEEKMEMGVRKRKNKEERRDVSIGLRAKKEYERKVKERQAKRRMRKE